MHRIAVFCGSKVGSDPSFEAAAEQLGSELAKRKIELVYGGGGIGLMGVLANSVLENGGKAIGVIPEKLYEMEVAHMGLTELYRVKTMHERKALMADLSDGFIAMPGGIGTLEEITEVITWAQIGYHTKPCAFLNTDNFFGDFFRFFEHMHKKGFLYMPINEQAIIDSDPGSLMDKLIVT
jgi:uncharacterized protein (TIGR00730 family)